MSLSSRYRMSGCDYAEVEIAEVILNGKSYSMNATDIPPEHRVWFLDRLESIVFQAHSDGAFEKQ